jgi:diguanylate cyclase (GGDEF)-like protein
LSPIPLFPIPLALVTATGGLLAGIGVGLTVNYAQLRRQHRALTRARHDAMHDELTGLPNRRAALGHLDNVLRTGRPVGMILLDLDRFKAVNDTYGHHAGDHVLIEVGRRLAELAERPAPLKLAARMGGDEYVLIVHGGSTAVAEFARAAFTAVTKTIVFGNRRLTVLASVGYAMAESGMTGTELLYHADMAMYRAKTTRTGVWPAATPATPAAPGGAEPRRRWRDRR